MNDGLPTGSSPLTKLQLANAARWTGISKLIGQAATFATTLFLARLLGKDDFGLFAMVVLYTSLIDNIADAGFQSAIIQRLEIDQILVSSCFWLLTLGSFFAVGGSYLAAPLVATVFSDARLDSLVEQVSWVFLVIPMTIVTSGLLSRDLRLDVIAKRELVAGLSRCVISMVLALRGLGVMSLVYGYMTERVMLMLLLMGATRWIPLLKWDYRRIMPLISFGINITAARLLWLGYSKIDTFIVGRYLGPENLGIYSIALQIAMAFSQFISAAYYRLLFPLLSRAQDSAQFNVIFVKSSVYLGIVAMPVMAGMAAVADDVVSVFLGPSWQEVTIVLSVLSWVAMLLTLCGLLPQALNAKGRADVSVWINLGSVLGFGVGFYYGSVWIGMSGVLIAWLILMPVRFLVTLSITCPVMRLSVIGYLKAHAGVLLATITMVVAVGLLQALLGSWQAPARLVLCVGAGIFAYLFSIFLFCRRPCIELFDQIRTAVRPSL